MVVGTHPRGIFDVGVHLVRCSIVEVALHGSFLFYVFGKDFGEEEFDGVLCKI